MNKHILYFFVLMLISSCGIQKDIEKSRKTAQQVQNLPFTNLELKDLSDFKPTSKNWQIVSGAIVDPSQKRSISGIEGIGVLLNNSNRTSRKNIYKF